MSSALIKCFITVKATVILTVLHEPADAEGENSRPNSPSVKSNSLRVRRRSVSNVLEATKSDPGTKFISLVLIYLFRFSSGAVFLLNFYSSSSHNLH